MPVTAGKLWRDERGMALPTAMIVLVILMALTFAFSSLATTEPSISRNHSMSAQARGYAESGVERAIWALNNPGHASGIDTAPELYDGTGNDFLAVSANGGFTVAVAGAANDRTITAVGWAPDSTGQLRAAKKIQLTLTKLTWGTTSPNCALCIKGKLDVGGNAEVDARSGTCSGSPAPAGGTVSTGTTTRTGSSNIYGPGNDIANEGADMPASQPDGEVNYSLTTEDLLILKSIAQANGRYYQGAVTFDGSNALPSGGGVVFVDTTTGADLTTTPSMTPTEQMGNVTITGNQTFNGWIIAMGDITVSGTVSLTGTVYARNDFVFNGNGTITGNVTGENKLGTLRSSVDASLGGSSRIVYNCQAAKTGGGTIASGWQVKPQTYREVDGV
ncbi:MAG: hypothetical protein HYU51_13885 [Candidatus Rokubacteria bacterium]|nr:hypothetical protein [Candidatus Rokubacteria bacterium]